MAPVYLKRKPYIVVNDFSFEIGRISVMRVCEIRIVRPILYGSPCTKSKWLFLIYKILFARGFYPGNNQFQIPIAKNFPGKNILCSMNKDN